MSRHLSAVVCAIAIVALAGCGGGKTQPAETAAAMRLCPEVLEAQKQYTAATDAMSLQFKNKPLVASAVKSIEALQARLGQLQPAVSEVQRRRLAPLAVALAHQLLTIHALTRHDLKTVAKYGNSINVPLRRGMVDLRKICSSSG